MKTAFYLFKSIRPNQWIKHGFILLPLLFARRVFHFPSLVQSLEAVAIFCLLVGAMYLINDLRDMESDRRHPVKRRRPLAAGLVSSRLAKVAAVVLLLSSLIWGASLRMEFFLVLVTYLTIQLLYSYRFKEIVILDFFPYRLGFFSG